MNRHLPAILMTLLFATLSISGCLGGEDSEPLPLIEVIETAEYNHTETYQFNNYAPMGMGNTTEIVLNATNMSVTVEINMSAGFHVPLLWDQGSVNVSILDENETVLWTNKTSQGQSNYTLVVSDNYSYNGNLTLQMMADGSDNATDDQVADWYVVRFKIWCEWEA